MVPHRSVILKKPDTAKTYKKLVESYLKDTNAFGNIYFATQFQWQGVVRESFFFECVSENIFDFFLITKNASMDYINQTYPGQIIKGTLNTQKIKKCSLDIIMEFYDAKTNLLISRGKQTIVFAEMGSKKICKIPESFIEVFKEYEI